MKVLSVTVENFASYESLSFAPSDRGLTLIQGPTGAGKSTLCDVIPWVLFGRTAKGGAVDEVISWNAKGPTGGGIIVDVGSNTIQVARTRKPNDLYYIDNNTQVATRGKDLADTQRMINELLGMDYDLYMMSSYFHEFSPTASFFTAKAPARRAIFEQLTDLSLADKLTIETATSRKELKALKDEMITEHKVMKARELELNRSNSLEINRKLSWDTNHELAVKTAKKAYESFETDKAKTLKDLAKQKKAFETDVQAQMKELEEKIDTTKLLIKAPKDLEGQKAYIQGQIDYLKNDKCLTCGSAKGSDRVMLLTRDYYNLEKIENDNRSRRNDVINYTRQWEKVSHLVNPYVEQLAKEEGRQNTFNNQLDTLVENVNPFLARLKELNEQVYELAIDISVINDDLASITERLADLDLLTDVISTYRASTLKTTVQNIENATNKLLVDHFDAEIKVVFTATDADKLEVNITKDGNNCQYTQLSKGQRCLLKLCFGISVMKQVALNHAITVDNLWFDESLDGCSDDIKMKALGVLERLAVEYKAVFCVEHSSALKAAFNNSITVNIDNGNSTIEST